MKKRIHPDFKARGVRDVITYGKHPQFGHTHEEWLTLGFTEETPLGGGQHQGWTYMACWTPELPLIDHHKVSHYVDECGVCEHCEEIVDELVQKAYQEGLKAGTKPL